WQVWDRSSKWVF
nr:immunoglobulin light chain junction region [Macaca mulatta]